MKNPVFWGRAYSLKITTKTEEIVVSSHEFEPRALRFTFNITQLVFGKGSGLWSGIIEITNCDGKLQDGPSKGKNLATTLIQEGDKVEVCAGYVNDMLLQPIWQGEIYQPIFERMSPTETKLTIMSFLGRQFAGQSLINKTLPGISTARQQAYIIATEALNTIPLNPTSLQVLDQISQGKQLPRARTYFGSPYTFLQQLAREHGCVSWIGTHGFNIASIYDKSGNAQVPASNMKVSVETGPVIGSYAPASLLNQPPVIEADGTKLSLIGAAKQTQFGVTFKVLLDSNLQVMNPLPQVKIPIRYVTQANLQFGEMAPYSLPAGDQYVLFSVRHYGDTRGNDWYSEVTAYSDPKNLASFLA